AGEAEGGGCELEAVGAAAEQADGLADGEGGGNHAAEEEEGGEDAQAGGGGLGIGDHEGGDGAEKHEPGAEGADGAPGRMPALNLLVGRIRARAVQDGAQAGGTDGLVVPACSAHVAYQLAAGPALAVGLGFRVRRAGPKVIPRPAPWRPFEERHA